MELGADIKSKNALWSALDSPQIAKLLILNGANVNDYWEYQPYLVARGKITLLHSAVRGGILSGRGGCLPVVELLVTNGAEVDPRDSYSCTPLYLAVLQENYLIVEYLITKGANINTCDEEYGITPLHQAVRFGNYHLVELLLGNGADVNANRAERPKIYETAGDRSPRDLPSLRLDSLLSNAYAKTPLHLVWDLDVAALLIAHGADVNAQDLKDGNTPLHNLVWLGEAGKEIVELLIDRGADITATNNHGQTILHQAAKFGCPYWLEYFIARGADVNAIDCYGATPLHLAIERFNSNDKFEIAKLLMSWHEDYDEYIVSDPTLYYSLCQRLQALIEVLIFNGADVNLANNKGETILHLAVKAVKNGLPDIVELVLAADADVNVQDKDGNLPSRLHELIDCRQIELAQLLISNGADIRIRDENDRSVLHAAVQSNLKEIVELLLLRGANINAKRKASFTPLDDALKLENWEVAELLVARGAVVNKQQIARISALLSLPDAKAKDYVNLVALVQV